MSVKVVSYTPLIKSATLQNCNIALRLMASAIVQEATPKTPKQFGDLRNNVLRQVLGLNAKVSWNQRYASIQESKQFRNYTTPGTGPHFAENAVKKVTDNAAKYFADAGVK